MSDIEKIRELRAELRELAATMQDVSGDGRRLASDLAMSIMEIVALQCNAVDERLSAVMRQLDQIEQRAA
jgi:hypothetical protein